MNNIQNLIFVARRSFPFPLKTVMSSHKYPYSHSTIIESQIKWNNL